MKVDEPEGQGTGPVPLAGQEDPLPGNEDVVEDGYRLHHLVLGGEGLLEGVLLALSVGTSHQLQPRGVDGHGEGHGVVGILRAHGAGGQHDDLVDVSGAGGVHLGPPHHDALIGAPYNVEVGVGVGLGRRPQGAIAFGVGLGQGEGIVVVPALLQEGVQALAVVGLQTAVHLGSDLGEGEEGIRADLLDQDDQRLAQGGADLDQAAAQTQVVGILRQVKVAAVGAAVAVGDGGQITKPRVLRQLEVNGGVAGGNADNGVGGDVINPLAAVIDRTTVAQALVVLVGRAQGHSGCPLS